MKTCKVEGCNNYVCKKEYCNRHYLQNYRHGKVLNRTIYDKNKIVIKHDYAEIVIYNKKCFEVARTKIDLNDVKKVKDIKWRLCNGYAKTDIKNNGKIKNTSLHRIILGNIENKEIDHINRDPLDNRKCNLRFCTRQENVRNRKAKGYTYSKKRNKWMANIMVNYKNINLGYFKKEEDAIKARRDAEKKYFGEFACKR